MESKIYQCKEPLCNQFFNTAEDLIVHKLTDHVTSDSDDSYEYEEETPLDLSLSNRNLNKITKDLFTNFSLTSLDISRNNLRDLKFLSNLPHIQVLNASCNKLTDLTFCQSLKDLRVLNIEYNSIESIMPLKDSKITQLYLRSNKLCYLSFLDVLESLDLTDLSIESNDVTY